MTKPRHTEVEVDRIPPCDLCKLLGVNPRDAAVDGATKAGPWANMCEPHFYTEGVGLGLGKGQRYKLREGA